MKKRLVAMLMVGAMVCSMAACGSKKGETPENGGDKQATSLSVTTTFAGNDGNAKNYKDECKEFTKETGIEVKDSSQTSDEAFKARVQTDFETGSEADVLFFFTGADANAFIEEGKVVSIADIRKEYPEYGSNMDDGRIPASLVDEEKYALPLNGFWEAMFCNTKVLDAAGVAVPGADYTWDQFLTDCQKIKDAGYTPIAAALGNIPHYWWEFSIFNNTSPATHLEVPASVEEGNGPAWVQGMEDIKDLYDKGFFPDNTNSAKDDETFEMFTTDKAAFLIDGSWKVGGIAAACQSDAEDPATLDEAELDKYSVTFVPSKGGERKTTDLIGGISMGYYITKKAWDDEETREAAVKFVEHMTKDDVVGKFSQHTATALKTVPKVEGLNSLQEKALEMIAKSTSFTGAVQDIFLDQARASTFDGMPQIVTGAVTAKDAVAEGLQVYADMQK